MSIELKIKSKHLGLEATVIRHEERKLKKQIRWQSDKGEADRSIVYKLQSIHNHRVFDVRNENRATFLARAYLEGRPYKSVEQKIRDVVVMRCYILPRMFEMVNKYGSAKDRIKKTMFVKQGYRTTFEYEKEEYNARIDKLKAWMGL